MIELIVASVILTAIGGLFLKLAAHKILSGKDTIMYGVLVPTWGCIFVAAGVVSVFFAIAVGIT